MSPEYLEMPALDDGAVPAAAARAACAVPPLWPLASSVAVNPFLGQAGEPLAVAAARLRRVAGARLTMPRAWYAERIVAGDITDADLTAALDAAPAGLRPASLAALRQSLQSRSPEARALPTVADLAAQVSGIDWPGLIADRFGHWAAGYFDLGQALWAAPQRRGAYAAWRAVAMHDLTPEIAGLTGFAATVADAPETAEEALVVAVSRLGLGRDALESYFHRLLATLDGWAQLARHRQWQAGLSGQADATLTDLIAVRSIWDQALLRLYRPLVTPTWHDAAAAFGATLAPTADDCIDAVLQDAAERAALRRLAPLSGGAAAEGLPQGQPALQMAFCIDVRSEIFRRALESLDPAIGTLGFAGFFGLGIGHRRLGSDVVEPRLPVLMAPSVFTCSDDGAARTGGREGSARLAARAGRAWGRFKVAAISSFAFVEAAGPLQAAKLLRDGLGFGQGHVPDDPPPRFQPALGLDDRIDMAVDVLKAMSLTDGFARLVLLAGHGARTVNNPHASGLQCGACGGFSGEVNARLLAAMLNDRDVRDGLAARGIAIPADTLFLAALHDTVTDEVTVYDGDHPSPAHRGDLGRAKAWLAAAGALARAERRLRLPGAGSGGDALRRARDWSELRPEWALAGCQVFVAAPRRRTAGRDLGGRAFLHDYDWRCDEAFGILEQVLAGPVVVASWISLQYYGSTVAPDVFGAGNKLLHNVTGGVGVVEGNGGRLRAGLPWQSVHDGTKLMHEPLRLSVLVEAPRAAIDAIVARHAGLRALFDNGWLRLLAIDDAGTIAWRYAGGGRWDVAGGMAGGQR